MVTSAPTRFCTACGESVTSGNRFCTGCGAPIGGSGEPSDHTVAGVSAHTYAGGVSAPKVDLHRYHDLTERLTAFATDGGAYLRGDTEDLQINDAEPLYEAGEEEVARIAGAVELVGPRSVPGVDSDSSLGLVGTGAGMLILTNRRVIVNLQHPGTTQLGQLDGTAVHTFVLPWDLVDSISMPARKSMKDRVAGARTIEIYALMIVSVLKIMPVARQLEGGRTGKLREEDAIGLLARTAAAHRLSVSPPSEHARLRRLLEGSFAIEDGDIVAHITDENTDDIPVHLVDRLVERTATGT